MANHTRLNAELLHEQNIYQNSIIEHIEKLSL